MNLQRKEGEETEMGLKRLTNEELKVKGREIFYDFMCSNEDFFSRESYEFSKCTAKYPTPMDMLHKETESTLEENKARIELFQKHIKENEKDPQVVAVLEENMNVILEEREYFEKSCMAYQKRLYAETGVTDYARSIVLIPLDKKINSYYDDLVLEVAFYDDLGTMCGRYNDYKKLTTREERRQFIIENTEITNMGFVILNRQRNKQEGVVVIEGKVLPDAASRKDIIVLDSKFSDFNTLSLANTMSIQNNDIRQLFQSKIDLDKEDMDVLADLNIRGDEYKLLKSVGTGGNDYFSGGNRDQLFIRYICPSTQRVYYNPINISYLEYSDYFKENDYNSYLEAWWNICHLGANPREGEFSRC